MALFESDNTKPDIIKIGEVSSVNYAAGTAQVVFDDEDSIVSAELPVLQRNTLDNADYAMPDIGEDVVCLFLATGREEGFILGSIYAGDIVPPESTPNKRTVVFADGTRVSYDRAEHILSVEDGDTSVFITEKSVDVETQEEVNLTCSNTVNIIGGAEVNLTAPAVTFTMGGTKMQLNGSAATIESADLKLKGNVTLEGNTAVTGNMTASGNITATGSVHGSNI